MTDALTVALQACAARLHERRRRELAGEPELRRLVAREVQWQVDWLRAQRISITPKCLAAAAGETAADLYVLHVGRGSAA